MIQPDRSWRRPPATLARTPAEVHVWRASLALPAARIRQLAQFLSDDERRRAEQFHVEGARRRFIAGRGQLRVLLSRYLTVSPDHLCFGYEASGKPHLEGPLGGELCFNLSHSHDRVLYAVSWDRAVGVDLERLRPIVQMASLAQRILSPRELIVFRSLPAQEREAAFFSCWTRKEAYVKARGDGLVRPLHQIDVSLAPWEPARPLLVGGQPEESDRWTPLALPRTMGYVASLAVEGKGWRLVCWQWPDSGKGSKL